MAFFQVAFSSRVLGYSTNMNVIIPQRCVRGRTGTAIEDETLTYPVLYLLHGMSDDHTMWCRRTSIERYADEAGIAVVMPMAELGWYTDMKHGRKWRTFIGEELPKICHSFFPQLSTKREDTYIAGLSMGGYGAYALALTYPERYAAAAGLSGAYNYYTKGMETDTYWSDIFGTYDEYRGGENDLLALSEKRMSEGGALPRLFMWCGTEDFVYNNNVELRDHLRSIGWHDFYYEEGPGDHSWGYWDTKIREVIKWIDIK